MIYNGVKITLRLLLLEVIVLILASYISIYTAEYIGEYPSMLIAQLFIFIPIGRGLIFLSKTHEYAPLHELIGLKGFDYGIIFIILLLPASAQNAATLIFSPIAEPLTRLFGEQMDIASPQTVSEFLWLFANLCIVAPIMEELLFRGVIMQILKPHGTAAALFISSFGFALLHFSPAAFLIILVVGIVIGLVRIYSDSIFPCILFHSLFNLQSLMLLVFEAEIENNFMLSGIYILGTALLFPVLFFAMYKLYGKGKWLKGSIKGCKGGKISLFLTIIIYALISAVSFYSINMK